jgi:predicted ATPase/DNA-binding winged helix-turn-helix (wHTH) protein
MTTSDQPSSSAEREYSFAPFRFIPGQQLLLHGDTPVRLGNRALDILAELVERPGELVSKRELMARAWPTSVVEESNLKVHVAALRRALCDDGREHRYVATVSGRGYRFVAPVTSQARAAATPAEQPFAPAAGEPARRLPAPAAVLAGRGETIAALLRIMEQRRCVNIVGPGGIGKSTVALPVAQSCAAQAGLELCFADLSTIPDAQFLAGAVAAAIGITIQTGDAQSLLAALHGRALLLVLDSCEHLIDAAAALAEQLIQGAPELRILATSREPLRIAGEYVYRLMPLAYPAAGGSLNAASALTFSAIQLFALRAADCLDGYQLSDADAQPVAEICRRLEGIPLAIELAATRMDALGAAGLAARLGDRFQLLKRGRRGVLERHRTLEAALDWSYELLSERQQALLRALSVFAGGFTLDDATGLCQDAQFDAATIVDGVANLVDKSLLSADTSQPCVHYRLLDTTKAYAQEKLDQCGETGYKRRRHLEYHRTLLERASVEWDTIPGTDWLARYGRCLDDVRAALAWAFAPGGDAALGTCLTVSAIPMWMQLSLLEEGRRCAERALAGAGGAPPEACAEMKLRAAWAAATLYANGPIPATEAAWTRVLALADGLQDKEYQLMALWGMAVCRSYAGEPQAVQALQERFRAVAPDAGAAPVSMERLLGTALHYAGDQAGARRHLECMLEHYAPPVRGSRLARFQLNQRAAALGTLACVLWLQGYPEQAVDTAQAALQEARASVHAQSMMYAISNAAFPLMLLTGDYPAAEAHLAELSCYMKTHALTQWETLWRCMQASLQVVRGDADALPVLQQTVMELQEAGYRMHLVSHLGTLAEALGTQGQRAAGLALINSALAACEAGEDRWYHPEVLRIKGALQEPADAGAAEQLYRQALAIAAEQEALSWRLRAATSLARLKMRQGAQQEGRQLLEDVLRQFSEGHGSADLRAARALLDHSPPSDG